MIHRYLMNEMFVYGQTDLITSVKMTKVQEEMKRHDVIKKSR